METSVRVCEKNALTRPTSNQQMVAKLVIAVGGTRWHLPLEGGKRGSHLLPNSKLMGCHIDLV